MFRDGITPNLEKKIHFLWDLVMWKTDKYYGVVRVRHLPPSLTMSLILGTHTVQGEN